MVRARRAVADIRTRARVRAVARRLGKRAPSRGTECREETVSLASYAVATFGSLFSIVDPFAAVPIFLALVGAQPPPVQTRAALRASATCFVVLTVFAAAGGLIFDFFGITLPAFKITGGVLLFGVGFEMMRAKRSATRGTTEEAREAETKDDVGLIPLGIPLLSGPGAIATVIVFVGKAQDLEQRACLFLAIAAVSAIAFVTLRSAEMIARVLGKTGINIVERVMGLILAAVAAQFVIDGLHDAFGWKA
jgi:multiple antibiotic resistance protein